MRLKNNRLLLVLGFLVVSLCTGCSKDSIDYSNVANWAFYPQSLQNDVDVFFIAPTSGNDSSFYMHMDDAGYKAAFVGATAMEKGIYDTKADFYAPFYRQVSLECYELSELEREKYLELAYKDIDNAFNYYMKNINNGRPYILAGFSQGGDMIKRLLEQNKSVGSNMVAAYAIGWYFTEEDVAKHSSIKMANSADDLGVVVSFCSEAPGYNGVSIVAPSKTIGINPLNWKTDGTIAGADENKGACFTNYSGVTLIETPKLCGAYLDEERGTLKVTDVTPAEYPAGLGFLEDGNYHLYDYQFFYRNLQENVELRIDSYLKSNINIR